jgi:hypothetical protein
VEFREGNDYDYFLVHHGANYPDRTVHHHSVWFSPTYSLERNEKSPDQYSPEILGKSIRIARFRHDI